MKSVQNLQEKSLQALDLKNALSLKVTSIEKAVNSASPSLTKMSKLASKEKVVT